MSNGSSGVMAGHVPAIYGLLAQVQHERRMPAISAGMTREKSFDFTGTGARKLRRKQPADVQAQVALLLG